MIRIYFRLWLLAFRFHWAMFRKMAQSERKHGWRGTWETTHYRCHAWSLFDHIGELERRGYNQERDYLDVAVLCAMACHQLRKDNRVRASAPENLARLNRNLDRMENHGQDQPR